MVPCHQRCIMKSSILSTYILQMSHVLWHGHILSMRCQCIVRLVITIALAGWQVALIQGQEEGSNDKKIPFSMRGSVGASLTYGTNSGLGGTAPPLMYTIYGNTTMRIYNIDIPLSFSFSRGQLAYTLPFDRFGISPKYKWLTVHAGHRNMRFNQFTLAGRTFFGAGVEMNPGKFRFSAMYGRLQDALPFTPDLLEGFRFIRPTFSRRAYAVKVGVGTDANHIDLSVFKGWDEEGSIPNVPDSLFITPEENLALGINFRKALFKRFSILGEAAASAYTQDVRKDNVLEDDQFAFLQQLFAPKYSTRINTAISAGLHYAHHTFNASLEYRRIDPYYQTMGAFYNLNDLENYTVNASWSGFNRTTLISASVGREVNDLSGLRSSQTERWIGSLNVQYNSQGGVGIGAGYQNYSMSSGQFDPNFFNDTLRIIHQMHTIFLQPNYSWGDGATILYSTMANVNYQIIDDQSPLTSEFGDMRMASGSGNFQWMQLLTGWTYNFGVQYHQVISQFSGQQRIGLTSMVAKRFKTSGIHLSGSGTLFRAISEVVRSGLYSTIRFNSRIPITKKQHFSAGIMWISRPGFIGGTGEQFNDIRINAGYQLSF